MFLSWQVSSYWVNRYDWLSHNVKGRGNPSRADKFCGSTGTEIFKTDWQTGSQRCIMGHTHTECTHTKDKTFAGMYRIDILKSEVKLSCLLIINKVMVFVCLFVMDVVCSYSKILQNESLLLVLFPFNVWNKGWILSGFNMLPSGFSPPFRVAHGQNIMVKMEGLWRKETPGDFPGSPVGADDVAWEEVKALLA